LSPTEKITFTTRRLCGLRRPKSPAVVPKVPERNLNVNALAKDVPKALQKSYKLPDNHDVVFESPNFFTKAKALVDADISQTPFAKGAYGRLFIAKFSKGYDASKLLAMNNIVGNPGGIPSGKTLALKIQKIRNVDDIRNCEREARVQLHVNKKAPGVSPTLYFSGYSKRCAAQVTIMDGVDGRPMARANNISAKQFLKLEAQVIRLWMAGVVHADLHTNNIIIDSTGTPRIIDYGRAIVVPEGLRPKAPVAASKRNYQNRLQKYTNAVVIGRRLKNDDYAAYQGYLPTNHAQYSSDVQSLRRIFRDVLEAGARDKLKAGAFAKKT
jgi:predicted Ser/Thr protein kinase